MPAHDGRHENDRDDRGGIRIGINLGGPSWERPPVFTERTTQVWVEPVYRTVRERVWVEAEYRTVVDRIWHEPVVQRVGQTVWVPDRYEDRDVVRYDRGRRVIIRERVLVEAGHYETCGRDIVVTSGYYEDCPRQVLVCEGHWATVDRQVLVCPGHWEPRVERIPVAPRPDPGARIDLRIPIRW